MTASDDLSALVKRYADLDMFQGYSITSPDSPGPDGDTPFHMAAYDGDVDAARIMLPFVADINAKGDIGNSPLHYAVLNNQVEMAKFLIEVGASIDQPNEDGDTPWDYMEGKAPFVGFFERLRSR